MGPSWLGTRTTSRPWPRARRWRRRRDTGWIAGDVFAHSLRLPTGVRIGLPVEPGDDDGGRVVGRGDELAAGVVGDGAGQQLAGVFHDDAQSGDEGEPVVRTGHGGLLGHAGRAGVD